MISTGSNKKFFNVKTLVPRAIILVFALLILTQLSKLFISNPVFEYSEGTRAGIVSKISVKGFFWKTNEGYFMTGSMVDGVAEKFSFSITDKASLECIDKNAGKNIEVSYKQYLIVPYSLGETDYLITSCKEIK